MWSSSIKRDLTTWTCLLLLLLISGYCCGCRHYGDRITIPVLLLLLLSIGSWMLQLTIECIKNYSKSWNLGGVFFSKKKIQKWYENVDYFNMKCPTNPSASVAVDIRTFEIPPDAPIAHLLNSVGWLLAKVLNSSGCSCPNVLNSVGCWSPHAAVSVGWLLAHFDASVGWACANVLVPAGCACANSVASAGCASAHCSVSEGCASINSDTSTGWCCATEWLHSDTDLPIVGPRRNSLQHIVEQAAGSHSPM